MQNTRGCESLAGEKGENGCDLFIMPGGKRGLEAGKVALKLLSGLVGRFGGQRRNLGAQPVRKKDLRLPRRAMRGRGVRSEDRSGYGAFGNSVRTFYGRMADCVDYCNFELGDRLQ